MFLVITILSMPIQGQAGVNDFNREIELGIDAPQWDEMLGHFDILPELIVVAARPEENATLHIRKIVDTVYVVAERPAPAAVYQDNRAGHGKAESDHMKYAIYITVTLIVVAAAAITASHIADALRKGLLIRKPQTVLLYQLEKRKGKI